MWDGTIRVCWCAVPCAEPAIVTPCVVLGLVDLHVLPPVPALQVACFRSCFLTSVKLKVFGSLGPAGGRRRRRR